MAQTINITCIRCKEDFTIAPYYRNTEIRSQSEMRSEAKYYTARTIAIAICPHCGEINSQSCESEITKQDIIDLAVRRYKRG
jgi:hypothetical protein